MTAASEKALAALHSQLAKSMTKALADSDVAAKLLEDHKDELPSAVSGFLERASNTNPALMAAISKFLKDNEITCQPEEGDSMSVLAQALRNKPKRVSQIEHIDETIN